MASVSGARSVSLREHLIVRIFYVCGLRPGELFALRVDDVEPKLLRIDEALKETEKGADRVGEMKTTSSNAYVSISDDLYKEINLWLSIRNTADPYHRNRPLAPNDLRGSPPLLDASVLSASRFVRLCLFPYHRQTGSRVPYKSPNLSHAFSTPDTTWPASRSPATLIPEQ